MVFGWAVGSKAFSTPREAGFQGGIKKIAISKNRIDKIDKLKLVLNSNDIKTAKKENRHGILWNFENASIIGGGVNIGEELNKIDLFYLLVV